MNKPDIFFSGTTGQPKGVQHPTGKAAAKQINFSLKILFL
jgi:acyl-coenzyme A synthetase/AMP-(fatty) acid ligase